MASQVLSGSSNVSYTNNTGQNVRVVINYMSNCTSMTWAGVTVTGSSTVVSKDTLEIIGEFRSAVLNTTFQNSSAKLIPGDVTYGAYGNSGAGPFLNVSVTPQNPFFLTNNWLSSGTNYSQIPNAFYIPQSIRPGGVFPTELILSNSQSFAATCSAYNIIVIKEDGT